MTYLTGKRFEYPAGNAAGTTTGVIVSEPFREACNFFETSDRCVPFEWKTCVAILWDDGSMEGAIDVELLKVVEDGASIPKRILDILTSEVANRVARHGYKCPSGFDYVDSEEDAPDTGDFYDAIRELSRRFCLTK